MSDAPYSPPGNQGRHLQAARNWLARAEAQFDAGQDIIAAGTLMLAQAELKLLVEGVASGAAVTHSEPRSRAFRLSPISRAVLGTAALAACLVIGVVLGRAWLPSGPVHSPGEIPVMIAQVQDNPPVSPEPETAPVETLAEEEAETAPATDITDLAEAVEEEILIIETPTLTRPAYRPPTTSQPVETSTTVSDAPIESEPAETVELEDEPETDSETETENEPDSGGTPSSGDVISPAEVALRTIRALSQHLNSEK